MIYKANDYITAKLLSMPESGMGYQIIAAKPLGLYRETSFVAYNAELLIERDNEFESYKRRLLSEGLSSLTRKAGPISLITNSIRMTSAESLVKARQQDPEKFQKYKRHLGGKGAKEGKEEPANGTEVFVRLSAYKNDRRIDTDNNCLVAGTFTTMLEDYRKCVETGDEPIERYAPPSQEPIKWAFYVTPRRGDILQRGIVQPDFGHDGGGEEAYFKDGTSPDTCELPPREYGK